MNNINEYYNKLKPQFLDKLNDKIRFKKQEDNLVYAPEHRIDTYYQICQFKNQFTKKYETRKIIFNEHGDILKIFEKEYSFQKLDMFMKNHKSNKYKVVPTNDIQVVDLPTISDMICVRSELINYEL
jgi:hypothetical protein